LHNKLRVIHFSTGHLGGAGLAARRLNQGLLDRGVDSTFCAIENKTFPRTEHEFPLKRSIINLTLSKFVTYLNLRVGKRVFFSIFNRNVLTEDFLIQYKSQSTILHFHNFYNLTDQETISSLVQKGYNVVVTLHDQRLLTGGCHYAFECRGFESSCSNCPQVASPLKFMVSRNMRSTRELAKEMENLYLIAPSKWMRDQAIKSRLLPSSRVRFIPNTLGTNFTAKSRNMKKAGDSKVFKLGIASMDVDSYIKGGDIVKQLVTEVTESQIPFEFVKMKDFEGDIGTEKFWESIDCLLVLSRADNSPNVIHEAKHFGIPVVGSMLGGITELLDPDFDYLVDGSEVSAVEIQEYLNALYSSPEFKEKLAAMKETFNSYVENSIDSHLEYYGFILQKTE
jgi:glycosyltransferase involved in cell wall biosynthesis